MFSPKRMKKKIQNRLHPQKSFKTHMHTCIYVKRDIYDLANNFMAIESINQIVQLVSFYLYQKKN